MRRREFITLLAKRRTGLLHEARYLLLGLVSLAVVTGFYFWLDASVVSTAFTYLVVLVLFSLVSNFFSLIVLSFIGASCLNYFFTAPLYSFRIDLPQDLSTVTAFAVTSLIINFLVTKVRSELRDHLRTSELLRDANQRLKTTNKVLQESEYKLRVDIDERKKAEDLLRRSEGYLAEAQKLSHTGTWVLDARAMSYLYWSDEAYRIWGFDPLQGPPSRENMWQRIHPDDRDRMWEEVQQALRQKRDFSSEFRILLPDGTIKYLEVANYHEFSSSGALAEAVCTQIDVTERKRAEQALGEEHERLRQLESDLAHMNRRSMIGELTASLAHEIAQPIATARNNARAALHFLDRSSTDPGEVREALTCVVDDADRAGEILDRIRDHIKKAPPRKEHVDVNHAATDVIALAQGAIVKNGVLIQTRLTEGLSDVQADPIQLQQVILNLILNAVEAMGSIEEGVRELLITTKQHEAGGVVVAVRDSGPGINPEHLDRVFDAFYTTKSSGLGMGLSICRSIIETHGGRLWADANEPRGAVFQFTLPSAENKLMNVP